MLAQTLGIILRVTPHRAQDFFSGLCIDENDTACLNGIRATAYRNDVATRCVAQARNPLVNARLFPVPMQQTQDHVQHVLHVLVRIQLAMKSCAKEDTYSVGVAGPTAQNASARSIVTVRTPRPQLCTRRLHSCLLSNGLAAVAALC